MPHPRRLTIALVLLAATSAPAQARQADEPATIELTVSPRGAPTPALAYRLLPMESERNPGDAAPVYLRLGHEFLDKARADIREKTTAWLALPIDRFPAVEARKYVDGWGGKVQQLEFAARRRTCDWNYTLPEQREHCDQILLPDAQELRGWAPLLAVKARVEIVEGRYDEAARTIQTGLSMSRHLAEAPFLINQLIGITCAHEMLDRLDELAARPDAPNLTWALAALPRPLIPIRNGIETEQKVGDWVMPEFLEADRPRSEAEWAPFLARLMDRLESLPAYGGGGAEPTKTALVKFRDRLLFRSRVLPEARRFVRDHPGRGDVAGDDRAIVLYLAATFADLRDGLFKASYLPYPEALPFYEGSGPRLKELAAGPLRPIVQFFPSLAVYHRAEAVLDRHVALLRVVEALRLHASAQGGRLPGSLAEVRAVPVPADPVTGRPFAYRLDGDAAILPGLPTLPPDAPFPAPLLKAVATYRVRLRP